jgi:REP element-mobilizing transposase RayT
MHESEGKLDRVSLLKRIERYLDVGYGSAVLKDERIAKLVQDSILFVGEKQLRIHEWVIMPNHVHLLAAPQPNYQLSKALHSLKSYTSHMANEILGRTGRFWTPESHDRFIRDETHFQNATRYIHNNPVKAGLCEKPSDWQWSSAAWKSNNARESPP